MGPFPTNETDWDWKISTQNGILPSAMLARQRNDMKVLKVGFLIFIGLVVVGLMAAPKKEATTGQGQQASTSGSAVSGRDDEQAKPSQPLMSTTAAEITKAYDDNTVAADQRFKGTRFVVSGTVADINTDILGRPYVTLRGGMNEFMEPQFAFAKENAPALAKLHKGNKVKMVCTGRGDIAKIPMSEDCEMI